MGFTAQVQPVSAPATFRKESEATIPVAWRHLGWLVGALNLGLGLFLSAGIGFRALGGGWGGIRMISGSRAFGRCFPKLCRRAAILFWVTFVDDETL